MRVSCENATSFTRWFNFNPVAMQLRWLYCVWGAGGSHWGTRRTWLVYLRTLDCVTPREYLGWLWMVLVQRRCHRWFGRPLGTLKRFFR